MMYKSYFRSSGYIAESNIENESGDIIDLTQIPAFLRTLMVTDGTVTKSLEAFFWEPVDVKPLSNTLESLTETVEGLEVKAGDKVLQREVNLLGINSETLFACARSTVSIKHLPKEVGKALEAGQIGIGELLREQGVETYRDIFNINVLKHTSLQGTLLSQLEGDVLSRSYRIRVNGHPAIIVSEYFPVQCYR